MELYIYNQDLMRLGIIDTFKTLIWKRKYFEPGSFEIHLSATQAHIDLLKESNIVVMNKGGKNNSGYIHTVSLDRNSSGEEVIIVKGYSLLDYLRRRISWGVVSFNGRTEELMRLLVTNNAIAPINQNRILPHLSLGNLQGHIESISYQNSYGGICDQLNSISMASGLGSEIFFDERNRRLVFNVLKGIDRTVSQKIVPPVIFSRNFDNIDNQVFYHSTKDFKNTALIAGEGEGDKRFITELNNAANYDRYEMFVDARDLSKEVNNTILTDDEYTTVLKQRGNEKLSENPIITTYEAQIIPNSNYTYRIDYDLGDIVSIVDQKWKMKVDARITEVEEVYESGKLEVTPTFGYRIPNILDFLNK